MRQYLSVIHVGLRISARVMYMNSVLNAVQVQLYLHTMHSDKINSIIVFSYKMYMNL